MRNASGHMVKNKQQWKISEKEHTQNFLYKTFNKEVSGSFML